MGLRIVVTFLCLLCSGCGPTSYRDITGQHRGDPHLQMDGAVCRQIGSGVPQASVGYSCRGACVGLTVATNAMNQQSTFDDCMLSRGWQEVN